MPRRPGVGQVEMWSDLLKVALPLVTFQQSTASRAASCPAGDVVLDAPDRPGLEWVFVARRP